MDEPELPASIALLWGTREQPRRGPKPGLSLDSVVRAAIELADAEGLGQLSMSRVAERLGFTTMSLYRYVKSKDDLLLLMADAASDPPPAPTPEDWRGGLAVWCRAILRNFRAHPWVLQVPITGPPIGPGVLAWMEAGLANLGAVELEEIEKLAVIQLLHAYVLGEALLSSQLIDQPPVMYGAMLRAVVRPEEHPSLVRLVESGALDEPAGYEDGDFLFGLQRVLDGVAAMIAGRGC